MKPAVRAAVEVARKVGIDSDAPELIQETNNTVVWLRPHEVIAKVGTHRDSARVLAHEHRVGSALAALDAPIAPPIAGVGTDPGTGSTVTLWTRLDGASGPVSPQAMGASLRELHTSLATTALDLPPAEIHAERARRALFDDERMSALPVGDRAFLRTAFEALCGRFSASDFGVQALHGEPHHGNVLATSAGIRWIDFEDACRGPLEWDLVFLPEDSLSLFDDVDADLLELLRALVASILATWGFVQARFPEMRALGEQMLGVVRTKWRE